MSSIDPNWRDRALCADHPDTSLWDDRLDVPGGSESDKARFARHQQAKALCGTCPVELDCRLTARPQFDQGVRGGRVMPSMQTDGSWAVVEGSFRGRPRKPREHGTETGWRQHRTEKDLPACDDCSSAHAEHNKTSAAKLRAYRQARRDRAAS